MLKHTLLCVCGMKTPKMGCVPSKLLSNHKKLQYLQITIRYLYITNDPISIIFLLIKPSPAPPPHSVMGIILSESIHNGNLILKQKPISCPEDI